MGYPTWPSGLAASRIATSSIVGGFLVPRRMLAMFRRS
ncbi:proton-translocating transhydrogenase family protein [Methylobacterium sp. NEAU 140]|nr:proton-translocating transhydrogenase family protein [Methylobacterium sp. NEAU 140]MDP4021999.1 proton-translocating transhydrogenase family protein [Methylobacterium sp. NEAU 140]